VGLRSARGLEDYIPEAIWFEVAVSEAAARANAQTMQGALVLNAEASVIG